tara:strand:- start:1093 stop:1623 length:531 start_codon:yes stop_codon:yes gene_type:complete
MVDSFYRTLYNKTTVALSLQMFGICLWYAILPISETWKPAIQSVMDRLVKQFNSFAFPAHITIKTNLLDYRTPYNYYKNIAKPYFLLGKVSQTCTLGSNGTRFYALQRALHLNGSKLQVSTYHISFCYRHTQFSAAEIDIVRRETAVFDRIDAAELNLQIWHCQDINPENWYQVSM